MPSKRRKSDSDAQQSLFACENSLNPPSDAAEIVAVRTEPIALRADGIRMGTSSFTAAGWESAFYPAGLRQADRLSYYATKYNTVEIDSTFYGTPALKTVQGWAARTPPGFLFAAKVPQVITHEKVLVNCEAEFAEFLRVMDGFGDKLGPLLFQFGYFNDRTFRTQNDFIAVLQPFLKKLPTGYRFALEIRNKAWMDQRFTELLRQHGVALALIDHSWMPRPWEVDNKFDWATADFTYIRWLGDRKEIEAVTDNQWVKTVVNRKEDLTNWAEIFRSFVGRKLQIFAYANNHYSGYGPGTVKLFWSLFDHV